MEKDVVKVRIKVESSELMPSKATVGSAGFDLKARKTVDIPPNDWRLIPTGVYLELPQGYEAQIRPRSGLALKYGVTVLNGTGTIDSDYRGEVGVILVNHSPHYFHVEKGMRIAQMIIQKLPDVELIPTVNISDTERSDGGFGSTGLK
jgi:dUTP pyrophosphatase